MKSTSFKETNILLKAGKNPGVLDLPACYCFDPDLQEDFIVAKFKLSNEELEKVTETKSIYVAVMGKKWMPMVPMAWNPFKDYGDASFIPHNID